jgi:hypothetical protein
MVTAHPGHEENLDIDIHQTPCWIERVTALSSIVIVDCPTTKSDLLWIEKLAGLSSVKWVDADYHISIEAIPNDLKNNQWHLQNTGQKIGNQHGLEGADISAVLAWDIQVGSKDIVVAIPDTGIYLEHQEL